MPESLITKRKGHKRNLSDVPLFNNNQDINEASKNSTDTLNNKRTLSFDNLDQKWDDLSKTFHKAVHTAEDFVQNIIKSGWYLVSHKHLPDWMRDNEYILHGHRPQLDSFYACFLSIFRMHSETLNIWTHLIGFLTFVLLAVSFLVQPTIDLDWQERAVVSVFFASAILALGFSWLFHTVHCHSEFVGRFFNKLDYAGIAILTIGSFVPWLHFSFFCHPEFKMAYLVGVMLLGSICIFVSLQDYFQKPQYRKLRAGLFVSLGLSGVIPCCHYIIIEGFWRAYDGLFWLVIMGICYITGAMIYALRFPECYFPGKVDIWFHSHQIFHVLVVIAALVHYKGILYVAKYRLSHSPCR